MKFKGFGSAASISAAAIVCAAVCTPASATVVATIDGAYDKDYYDTPELDFFNTSGGTLTNVQMVLYGYQSGTQNYGISQTVPLPDMGAGESDLVWGFIPGANGATTAGNLTAYDYDDEWGNTPAGYFPPACYPEGQALCSDVGNFKVTFTATISGGTFNGDPVYSVFSPTNNYTGGFVGWEGLDPSGISESVYDEHSGTFSGTMAVVQIGTPPPAVPEPATWAMLILGLGAVGVALRRRAVAMAA
jgi:hypothetical protein